jgi:hypothetical protein
MHSVSISTVLIALLVCTRWFYSPQYHLFFSAVLRQRRALRRGSWSGRSQPPHSRGLCGSLKSRRIHCLALFNKYASCPILRDIVLQNWFLPDAAVGVSPIAATGLTGFSLTLDPSGAFSTSTQVVGHLLAASYSAPTPATLTAAIGDMGTAFTDANGRVNPNFNNLASGELFPAL